MNSGKKTILYIGGMEFPDGNAAAQRVIANSYIMRKIGYDIILLGVTRCGNIIKDSYFTKIEDVHGFSTYVKNYPNSVIKFVNYSTSAKDVIHFLKKNIAYRVSAIIAYNYPAFPLWQIANYCKNNGIYIYADATEWYTPQWNVARSIDTFLRMRCIHPSLHGIICISDYLEKYYKKRGCKTTNIPSLVVSPTRKVHHYTPNKIKNFTYAGSPGKNGEKDRLDYIIKAFSSIDVCQNYRINIAGLDRKQFIKIYPEMSQYSALLNKNAVFYGRLQREQISEIISKSDFTIFARDINRITSAGFPTKMAESFSFGTPVITNPTSNIARYIVQGKNGFVAEDCSIEALRAVILQALRLTDEDLTRIHQYCIKHNNLEIKLFLNSFEKFLQARKK